MNIGTDLTNWMLKNLDVSDQGIPICSIKNDDGDDESLF